MHGKIPAKWHGEIMAPYSLAASDTAWSRGSEFESVHRNLEIANPVLGYDTIYFWLPEERGSHSRSASPRRSRKRYPELTRKSPLSSSSSLSYLWRIEDGIYISRASKETVGGNGNAVHACLVLSRFVQLCECIKSAKLVELMRDFHGTFKFWNTRKTLQKENAIFILIFIFTLIRRSQRLSRTIADWYASFFLFGCKLHVLRCQNLSKYMGRSYRISLNLLVEITSLYSFWLKSFSSP